MSGKVRSAWAATLAAVAVGFAAGCDQGTAPSVAGPEAAASPPTEVEAPAPVAPFDVQVDLSGLTSAEGWAPASVEVVAGGAVLRSNPGSGGYSAMLNFEGIAGRVASGSVKVELEVKKGAIGIWAAKLGNAAEHIGERVIAQTGPVSVVEIPLADVSVPFTLMFSNGAASGVSEATINRISVAGP